MIFFFFQSVAFSRLRSNLICLTMPIGLVYQHPQSGIATKFDTSTPQKLSKNRAVALKKMLKHFLF